MSERQISSEFSTFLRALLLILTITSFSSVFVLTPANQIIDTSSLRGGKVEEATTPRLICNIGSETKEKAPIKWVVFMGDSNMRHTYHWWATNGGHNNYTFGVEGSSFGMDLTDKGPEYRWADQEMLFKEDDSSVVRYSFRFLHGSVSEFVHDTQHWDVARKSAEVLPNEWTIASMKKEQREAKAAETKSDPDAEVGSEAKATVGGEDDTDEEMWKGRVRPSDFALWATKNKEPIKDNSIMFNSWMDKWTKKASPDVVILTEGWGGVPRARASEIVRKIVRDNPATLFIWAPVSSHVNFICIISNAAH